MNRTVCLLVIVATFSTLGCRKLFRPKRGSAGIDPAPTATFTSTPTPTFTAAPITPPASDTSDVKLGALRVTMPGTPTTTTKREPSAAGDAIIIRHEVTVGDSFFASSFIAVPNAKTWNAPGSVNGAIENAIAAVRNQAGTKLVRATGEKSVTVADMKGRDVTVVVERTDGTTLHARLLSVSRSRENCFLVAVVHTPDDPLVKRMYASLRPGF
jgi:hypothetical protein